MCIFFTYHSANTVFIIIGMTLAFFFQVQDTGSWLEIGQSISFFCITSLLLLWSAGICAAGEYLMPDAKSGELHHIGQKLE